MGVDDQAYKALFGIFKMIRTQFAKNNEFPEKYEDYPSHTAVWAVLNSPRSRGFLKLKSNDPEEHPIIHNVSNTPFPCTFDTNTTRQGYLEHSHDVKTIVEAAKDAFNMKNTKVFKDNGLIPPDPYKPCSKQHGDETKDAYWECYVRHFIFSVYHYCSTAKMGPKTDSKAVVDHQLKIYGLERIRVIDASIIPAVVGANTNAATIMIGEKGADMILKEWGAKSGKAQGKDEL